ncbi:MAG: SHOCT domain-containing protein [Mesorhizobium sp.]|nr:SHOCT domain-containing protein [Mesorhizobium sp.]RUV40935.1 SHOCT domain-containing protein [Mesorhizobium sp. M1A.T.Ca.IN.004.03.1.1]RWK27964.1 MAG: SHOCT domain-containing protein [Mesorhizobium sp.]RWK87125.1 MAG: SHOCT domain-containing protein [Mesorhizobium sp.]TIP16698.1 MAG: SHOCT domain-containing protein [Mesorhizobium sp.]TIQ08290.1 MAG: SHOCT domain-containing protein [Mesorhizobium sp.]
MKSVAVASAVPALLPIAAWAQAPSDIGRYEWGPHMMWWGGGWYAMIFGPLFMMLFLAVLVAAAVLLVRGLGGPWSGPMSPHHPVAGRAPLDILRERFARGEIDKEEFEERRRVLGE